MNYKWNITEDFLIDRYVNKKMNGYEIADEIGCCARTVYDRMIKYGIKRKDNKGKNNPSWRGGKYIQRGYIMVKAYDHPNRNSLNYVSEHVLIMEKKIGRYIKKGEIIHHINGRRGDNRIENLLLCKNDKEHKSIEGKLVLLSYKLVQDGILVFDRDKRKYRLSVVE